MPKEPYMNPRCGQLGIGTVIRNKGSKRTYTVIANDGRQSIAVATVHVSNPSEWEIVTTRTEHLPKPIDMMHPEEP